MLQDLNKRTIEQKIEQKPIFSAGRSAITSIKLLYDYARDIKDIFKCSEFIQIVSELSIQLAEMQIELANKTTETLELKEKLKEIEQQKKQPKVYFDQGLCYEEGNDNPLCNHCYRVHNIRIELQKWERDLYEEGYFKCSNCHTEYLDETINDY